MNIKKILYGDNNPSRYKLIIFNTTFALVIVMMYSIWNDFIPSPVWYKIGSWLSIALATFTSIAYYWALFTKKVQLHGTPSALKKGAILIILPFFITMIYWGAIVHGAATFITRYTGDTYETYINVKKDIDYRRRTCDYQLKGDILDKSFFPYICISKELFYMLPNEIKIRSYGRRSIFGYVIFGFRPNDNR